MDKGKEAQEQEYEGHITRRKAEGSERRAEEERKCLRVHFIDGERVF